MLSIILQQHGEIEVKNKQEIGGSHWNVEGERELGIC